MTISKARQEEEEKMMRSALANLFQAHVQATKESAGISHDVHANRKEIEQGSYPFVPNQPIRVLRLFAQLRMELSRNKDWSGFWHINKSASSKFLDAGCGIGNIMTLASSIHLCNEIEGLELFDNVIREGRKFLDVYTCGLPAAAYAAYGTSYPQMEIKKANIIKFKKYGDYDVIYYFCPMKNEKLETLFEERVEDQMKIGAIVIPFMKGSNTIQKDKRFRLLSGVNEAVYMKVSDGKREFTNLCKTGHHPTEGLAEHEKPYEKLLNEHFMQARSITRD